MGAMCSSKVTGLDTSLDEAWLNSPVMCVCVCALVCVRARVCVCFSVRVRVRVRLQVRGGCSLGVCTQ
jgi:hypothetical protein